MKDLQSKIKIASSIAPAAITATTNGTGVDLLGFFSAMLVLAVGVITDGTHTPKLQESDDNSAWNDVSANDQVGTLVDLASNVNQKLGYKGVKRYVRAVSTVSGATTGGVYSAQIIQGNAALAPVA